MVRAIFDYGVIGQSRKKKLIEINPVDLRDFTLDKHRSVDGRPFGGGPGMVVRIDIVDAAISYIRNHNSNVKSENNKIVLLSPQGRHFNQKIAEEYSRLNHLILISGRYEGVDERVAENLVDEELSIGGYVLSGGEIPAMVVTDTVARLIPGVLGKAESLKNETFEMEFDYPVYTEPVEYRGWKVPDVLRSGNHAKIKSWREEQAKIKAKRRHPGI